MSITSTLMLSLVVAATSSGDEPVPAGTPDCYDIAVRAKVIDQIPSVMPECDDCLIMSWPWFLDLKIGKVLEGQVDSKVIRALAVQHTYLRSRYGIWRLRRNAAGGFNVAMRLGSGAVAARCSPDVAPPQPYIRSNEKTLDDLRNQGIERYGHHQQ